MRNALKHIVFLLLLISNHVALAQPDTTVNTQGVASSDWKESGITVGVNFAKYLYGEIGYYRAYVYEMGGPPMMSAQTSYGCEFSYFDRLVLAPKIQGRISFYFASASLSAIFYSDLGSNYAFKLRPEIGIGMYNFDIHYGYNIGLFKHQFERTNKHVISLRYNIRITQKIIGEYDFEGNEIK